MYNLLVTADLKYDDNISYNVKLFFLELERLSSRLGYCFANNEYLKSLFNVTSKTIRNWLKKLSELKYIKISDDVHRKIFIYRVRKNKNKHLPKYYTIMPFNMVRSLSMPYGAKFLYSEIKSLQKGDNPCFCTNKYLSKIFSVSERTITRWLSILSRRNYIVQFFNGKRRQIYLPSRKVYDRIIRDNLAGKKVHVNSLNTQQSSFEVIESLKSKSRPFTDCTGVSNCTSNVKSSQENKIECRASNVDLKQFCLDDVVLSAEENQMLLYRADGNMELLRELIKKFKEKKLHMMNEEEKKKILNRKKTFDVLVEEPKISEEERRSLIDDGSYARLRCNPQDVKNEEYESNEIDEIENPGANRVREPVVIYKDFTGCSKSGIQNDDATKSTVQSLSYIISGLSQRDLIKK